MIPLTAVPLVVYATRDDVGRLLYLRGLYAVNAPETAELPGPIASSVADRASLRSPGVPVLVYHGIGRGATDTDEQRYVVSRERFAEQMRSLSGAGYEPVALDQLARYLRTGDASFLPPKPILITFDDGRADVMLQVDHVLRDTGMTATMFITGERVESGGLTYVDWEDLKQYADSGRWEIGSHTYDLHDVRRRDEIRLSSLTDWKPGEPLGNYRERLVADLDRNDAALSENLDVEPAAFAYPYGDVGEQARAGALAVLRQVLDERFDLAFAHEPELGWHNALPGDDRLAVARLPVENWSGLELLDRLQAAGALSEAIYAERALDYDFSEAELAAAAGAARCLEAPGREVVTHRRGLGKRKLVALTFDEGPSVYTPQILDVLRSRGAEATFFVAGSQIAERERLLQRMLVEGSEIGSGALDQRAAPAPPSVEQALEDAGLRVEAAVPIRPCVLRAPSPAPDPALLDASLAAGMQPVLWSVDAADDAEGQEPAEIARRVLEQVRPGAVVRLHDGGGVRWPTVQALPIILDQLAERGFQAVTVSELLLADRVRAR